MLLYSTHSAVQYQVVLLPLAPAEPSPRWPFLRLQGEYWQDPSTRIFLSTWSGILACVTGQPNTNNASQCESLPPAFRQIVMGLITADTGNPMTFRCLGASCSQRDRGMPACLRFSPINLVSLLTPFFRIACDIHCTEFPLHLHSTLLHRCSRTSSSRRGWIHHPLLYYVAYRDLSPPSIELRFWCHTSYPLYIPLFFRTLCGTN